jgi:transposase
METSKNMRFSESLSILDLQNEYYQSVGIALSDFSSAEKIDVRNPPKTTWGRNYFAEKEKEALRNVCLDALYSK